MMAHAGEAPTGRGGDDRGSRVVPRRRGDSARESPGPNTDVAPAGAPERSAMRRWRRISPPGLSGRGGSTRFRPDEKNRLTRSDGIIHIRSSAPWWYAPLPAQAGDHERGRTLGAFPCPRLE